MSKGPSGSKVPSLQCAFHVVLLTAETAWAPLVERSSREGEAGPARPGTSPRGHTRGRGEEGTQEHHRSHQNRVRYPGASTVLWGQTVTALLRGCRQQGSGNLLRVYRCAGGQGTEWQAKPGILYLQGGSSLRAAWALSSPANTHLLSQALRASSQPPCG